MSDRSELMSLIDKARYNPGMIQRTIIDQLERTHSGELELIDPMNPFVFLVEAASTLAAGQMLQAEMLTRRQYPQSALTQEDLYHHMSDKDYVGRFALPSSVKMTVLLGKEEIIQRAVSIGTGNIRKLTIPRHTAFKIADTYFTMQYPIDIRVMGHGGIQIVYDGSKDSPLYTLDTNKVEWRLENYNIEHQEYINLEIPVQQFRIDSYNAALNGTSAFKKTYTLNDQFYHCRAFMADRTGNWSEMSTTHSDQVFDPLNPTLLLRVVDNILTVSLPQVYYTSGLANAELRIDIYTTKGPMELPLQSYVANMFTAKWLDLDKDDDGKYVAPLLAMKSIAVLSTDMVTGGGNGLSFVELRERVMRNTLGSNDLPITPAQISARLTDLGYNSVLNIDNITNRVYLATRALPLPSSTGVKTSVRELSAGAGAAMATLNVTLNQLVGRNGVVDNGDRLTLTPDLLYRNENGVFTLVSDDEVDEVESLPPDRLVRRINIEEFLYSPLHYVLDVSENTFAIRPYYLGNVEIKTRHFIEDNDTVGVGVNSSIHAIERTANGWRLVVQTDTDESYRELPDDKVFMQLCFRPVGEGDNAYMNGTLIGKVDDTNERIYEFIIDTNFDIDSNHHIGLTSFSMYEAVNRTYLTGLVTNFDIIYGVADYTPTGVESGWIDSQLGNHLLPNDVIGVYYERLTVSLGESLHGLWTRARSVISSEDYQRYDEDVIATYPETVYERDATGAIVIVDNDGLIEFSVLHRKGDEMLDDSDNPIILFSKNEIVLDENRNPIAVNTRDVMREMDLFLVDGVYYFATGQSDIDYISTVPQSLVNWLTKDIRPLGTKLLEKTSLYLHPRATVGHVKVIVGEGVEKKIRAAQELLVTFHITASVFKDMVLRASIEDASIEVIADLLSKPVVVRDQIQTTIKAVVGVDIISVEVTGLGGGANYSTITVADDAGRLCIGKRLVTNPDNTYIVQDNIQFQFLNHTQF